VSERGLFLVPFSRHLGIVLFLMSSFAFEVSLDVAACWRQLAVAVTGSRSVLKVRCCRG
jgi:hypothetical protein